MCKLSIVIPTFDRVQELSETLNSILLGLPKDTEIVVSDNGSTDGTVSVLKEYQCHYPLKITGFNENKGIDRNIVNSIQKASGEYIFFVSDDDLILPGTINKVLNAINTYAPSIVYLNHFPFFNGSLRTRRSSFLRCKNKVFHKGEAFFKLVGLGFLSCIVLKRAEALKYVPSVVYEKECAHIDIASRVALKEKGPFIFLGSVSVAARAASSLRYDPFYSCIFNQKGLFDSLLSEGILSKKAFLFLTRRLLLKDFVKIFLRLNLEENQKKEVLINLKKHFFDQNLEPFVIKVIFNLKNNQKTLIYNVLKCLFRLYHKTKCFISV